MLAGGGVDVRRARERGLAVEHAPRELEAGGGVLAVAGDAALGVAREVEVVVDGRALRGRVDVAARLAHALHGGERDHAAAPLDAVRGAAGAAPAAQAAGGQHGLALAPLTGERADLRRRDATLGLSPLTGLGHAVGLAEHVLGPLVEAVGVRGHVLLVVGALLEPRVGDGEGERVVGADLGREPLVADEPGGVVVERVDEDHLDAQVLHPEAARRGLVRGVDAGVGLRVGRPEDDHLGVLQRVLEQVVLLGVAQAPAEAPHVHAAPVPAFPAVRVMVGVGEAHHVHEAEVGAVAVPHVAPHVVRARAGEDRRGTGLVLHAVDLADHDVGGLVPRDRLVAGDAAVLGIALAVGVEVHALQRRLDAPVGVDHGLEAGRVDRVRRLARRRERLAPGLDLPRRRIDGVVEVHGGDADDLAVLHIDEDRAPGRRIRQADYLSHVASPSLSPGGIVVARIADLRLTMRTS